jgi:DNA-binding transcriptional LysR family regulator
LVAIEVEAGYLRAVPLIDVGVRRPVGLMWRKDDALSPLSQRFVEIVRSLRLEEDAPVPGA